MMHVTLFGTRGSVPAPGPETVRYGGNTPSVEVRANDGTVLVLDAGTGIRRLGGQISPDTARVDILLTHLHMDHIQGLGFFGPLHNPGIDVHIWGPASSTLSLSARLTRYLSPPLFPVRLGDLPRVTCHDVPRRPFEIGPFDIQMALVCHPNPTVGYRIQTEDSVTTYIPDHEPALGLKHGEWLEPEWTSGYDLAADTDLLIHDAQFTDEEYEGCVGWGHSTYLHAFEFAKRVGAKEFVPFHHDPTHDDETLDQMADDAMREFNPGFAVTAGREGTMIQVGSERMPVLQRWSDGAGPAR